MKNQGMKNHVRKAAACFLAGAMAVGMTGVSVAAEGITLVGISAQEQTAKEPEAVSGDELGVKVGAAQAEEAAEEIEETETETEQETETPIEELVNTVAVSQLGEDSYINIRMEPSTESDIVGKLYNNNAATILGEEGDFYLIQSGNCQGYVAKYLLTTGSDAAEVAAQIGTPVAQVNAEALMVRADASEDAEVIDMVSMDDVVYLEEDLGGWARVSTNNGYTGYVNADYVSYATYLPQAESVEEEAARIAAEEAAYEQYLAEQEAAYEAYLAQQQAEWEAQNQAWIEYLESQGQYADDAQAAADAAWAEVEQANAMGDADAAAAAQAAAEQAQAEADAAQTAALDQAGIDASQIDGNTSLRQQIVNYALQFVGNPYVWGGTSLTNGADCSGFTQSVMGDNGISISRTAGAQSQGGRSVSLDAIQPGDLLFYSGSGDYGIGHVSMYIGDGKVVHASNSKTGIIVSDIDYRTPVSAKSYID